MATGALDRSTASCEGRAQREEQICIRDDGVVLSQLGLRTKGGRGMSRILFGCLLLSGAMAMSAAAENAPGVTEREIKIGQTMPLTGPAAWASAVGWPRRPTCA